MFLQEQHAATHQNQTGKLDESYFKLSDKIRQKYQTARSKTHSAFSKGYEVKI